MNKVLDAARNSLDINEKIEGYLNCSILTFIYQRVYRPGVLIATNKRLFFYGANLGVEFNESFKYEDISSIEDKGGLLKKSIVMHIDGASVKISNIVSLNINEFLDIVIKHI